MYRYFCRNFEWIKKGNTHFIFYHDDVETGYINQLQMSSKYPTRDFPKEYMKLIKEENE